MSSVEQLERLTRMHSLLSRVNRAIVRAESPDQLFEQVCRIAVDTGLFEFAWLGLLVPGSLSLELTHVYSAADSAEGASTRPEWPIFEDDALEVAQTGRHMVSEALPDPLPLLQQLGLLLPPLRGGAYLPIAEAGRVVGVLAVYTCQQDVFDPAVVNLLVEVAGDISFCLDHILQEQRRLVAETKVQYMALYDRQTGLPNRTLLEERIATYAERSRNEGKQLVVALVKLYRLDQLVQMLGHADLDEAIRVFGLRLEGVVNGTVARLAPGEFALAVPGLASLDEAEALAATVQQAVDEVVPLTEGEVYLAAAVGGVLFPIQEAEVGQLLRRARAAVNVAMQEGAPRFYRADFDRDSDQRLSLEAALYRALERDEFELRYQPQASLKSGAIVGAEALLRWRHPEMALVEPARFIPLLEQTGMMVSVGEWVLRTACKQNKAWQDMGLPPVRVAVNLSAQQMRRADMVQVVEQALRDSGLAPEWLELELTESMILEDATATIRTMRDLKALGIYLSLDDFGTGYSSLAYLQRFPVDRIKIDKSFINDVTTHAGSAAIVRSILNMAENLGLAVVAEGVETSSQLHYLQRQTCADMQGYVFSKPVSAAELADLLRTDQRLTVREEQSSGSYTVLVVDDEENICKALRRLLRREGLTVLTAQSADEAFEVLAANEVGVIICDQRMPGRSGIELLDQVKSLYPNSIRILLTGYAEFTSVVDAINRGALFKVLTKPWEDALLIENVREAFRWYEALRQNRQAVTALSPEAGKQAPD